MAHFGVLSYKGSGHLNPLFALSRRLQSHGHTITFFQSAELEERVRQQGFNFIRIEDPPQMPRPKAFRIAAWSNSIAVLQDTLYRLRRIEQEIGSFLHIYPQAIRGAGVEVLILGEISLAGPTVAELLQLPYLIISTSIPHNFGWDHPIASSVSIYGYGLQRLQKEFLEVSILRMKGPVRRALDRYRKQMGLGPTAEAAKTFPESAHITQWPQCLDLIHPNLSANFFYTGPFVDALTRSSVPFPWELLDGRPVVYASLGTTRKGDLAIFRRIAEACANLSVQLIVSLGGRRDTALLGDLPDGNIVVKNAPQLEILRRSTVVITHAGPNTVLETLLYGRPMLMLPIALDQPTVASRIERLGAAEVLAPHCRSADHIRKSLQRLLLNPSYRRAAESLQAQICSISGLDRAVEIIENVVRRKTPASL